MAAEIDFKELKSGDEIYIADLPDVGHGVIRAIRDHARDGWEVKINFHEDGKPPNWSIRRSDWLTLSKFDGIAR